MNDNLPEISFKEKKEKKRGALGWLRSRLGLASRGGIEEAGINPAAMNIGRAGLGGSGFGSSAGKAGLIATIAMVAVAGGVYLAHNSQDTITGANTGAFSSNKTPDNYVPAILRSQSANQGSSLDMFKETNKGAGLAMEGDTSKAAADKAAADAKAAPADGSQPKDDTQAAPAQDNMAQNMMGKLQGGNMASLTSQLGGGDSKFSNMGGFGNKFGSGATGAKAGFSSGIGAGFSGMPKFDQRKNKMMAMKGSARPVFAGGSANKRGAFGTGAFSQAKGLKATQKSYTGTNIDSARSTQDKAWEGSTPDGSTGGGGAGLSDGGAGVVTSPSMDNASGGSGGGGTGTPSEPTVPNASDHTDASPWAGIPAQALMMIVMSIIMSAIASYLISIGVGPLAFLKIVGYALACIALALALYATYLGLQLMASYGQTWLGLVYTVGGGCAAAAAALAFAGSVANNGMQLAFSAMAGVAVLVGGMLGK